jgi:hypothetical protein
MSEITAAQAAAIAAGIGVVFGNTAGTCYEGDDGQAAADAAAAAQVTANTGVTNAATAQTTANAHHTRHEPGGADAMAVDAVAATGSLRTLGTSATSAYAGDLGDAATTAAAAAQTTANAHHARHEPGGADAMAVGAAAGVGSLRTIGTGALEACAGNDSRLSNSRTPTAHATSHVTGGSDIIANAVAGGNAGLMVGTDKTKLDGITAGASTTKDAGYYRQVGTATFEAWYPIGQANANLTSTRALNAANTIYAIPHVNLRACTIDRIAICTTVPSANNAQNCRLGIYQATSDTNLYPGTLILDAGTVNLSGSGALAININQVLAANTLYYFVVTTSQTDATLRCITNAGANMLLGIASTLPAATNGGFEAPSAFGALPGSYPAAAPFATTTVNPFAIYVRYSA